MQPTTAAVLERVLDKGRAARMPETSAIPTLTDSGCAAACIVAIGCGFYGASQFQKVVPEPISTVLMNRLASHWSMADQWPTINHPSLFLFPSFYFYLPIRGTSSKWFTEFFSYRVSCCLPIEFSPFSTSYRVIFTAFLHVTEFFLPSYLLYILNCDWLIGFWLAQWVTEFFSAAFLLKTDLPSFTEFSFMCF